MIPQLARWLDWIVEEHHKHRPVGLDRVELLASRLNILNPSQKSVVVAGTNGKGSTVRYLEQILRDFGYTVGTTTSPHLYKYNERVRICNRSVSDEDILQAFVSIEEVREGIPLTYFEWTTLAALEIFNRYEIERAILEVGLGGRLDACNVVNRTVNVITNIGMDHTQVLGSDREAIGTEKAGILRAGIPLVYGDEAPVSTVIRRAEAIDCRVYRIKEEFCHDVDSNGAWQCWATSKNERVSFTFAAKPSLPHSALLAVQTALILENSANNQLEKVPLHSVELPGRLEFRHFRGRDWLLDVAHNFEAAKFVKQQLDLNFGEREFSVLLGCLEDKDAGHIVDALGVMENRVVVTSTHGHRGQSAEKLAKKLYPRPVRVEPDLEVALDYLVSSTNSHDLILVAGSFELVGRLRKMNTIGIGRRG
ncbi:MAG: Mur ligase family protein [Gammaproteobacteria bacterium]|nr:Mur ligase family protein [Gammaproteobacteria bacterium]